MLLKTYSPYSLFDAINFYKQFGWTVKSQWYHTRWWSFVTWHAELEMPTVAKDEINFNIGPIKER